MAVPGLAGGGHPSRLDERLQAVVDRIVRGFSPSLVLLFGSRARGDVRPDSDVDLLVVWKDEQPPVNAAAVLRLALGPVGFPMDLAVLTPSQFATFSQWRGHFVHSAVREGMVLHAA